MTSLSFRKHAQELRDTWQGRALAHAKGQFAAVLLSVLAHSYEEALPTLLRVVFPGFKAISMPFYSSCGRIGVNGSIFAEVTGTGGKRNELVFKNEAAMTKAFRDLADELKLSDADRIELFAAAKRWIVADWRVGPDGQRLAS